MTLPIFHFFIIIIKYINSGGATILLRHLHYCLIDFIF